MTISLKDVHTIATLARLELNEHAAREFTSELAKILDYVKKLDELDTSNVPPTLQVSVEQAPLRADERTPGLSKNDVLAQAPRADSVGFLVPGFVDEP